MELIIVSAQRTQARACPHEPCPAEWQRAVCLGVFARRAAGRRPHEWNTRQETTDEKDHAQRVAEDYSSSAGY
jgi:hypothetical protein